MIDHDAGERAAVLAEMNPPQPDAAELERRADYARITSSIGEAEVRRFPPSGRWFGNLAPALTRHGYSPVPVMPGQKGCMERAWPTVRAGDPRVLEWCSSRSACGVGIVLHELVAIDIDADDLALANRLDAAAVVTLGEAPVRIGRWPRRVRLYRGDTAITASPGVVEIRTGAMMLCSFGLHPDTRRPYVWLGESPYTLPADELPAVTAGRIADYQREVHAILPAEVRPAPLPDKPKRTFHSTVPIETAPNSYIARAIDEEFDKLARAPNGQRNKTLNTVTYTLSRFVASRRLDGALLADKLLDAAIAIGLSEREARSTIASAQRGRGVA